MSRLLRTTGIDRLEERQLLTVTPLGGEFRINELVNNDQQLARPTLIPPLFNDIEKSNRSVAVDHDGDFVVVWTSYGDSDGDGAGIFGRLFNRFAIPLTGDFQINQFTEGDQRNATVTMDADGDFTVAWESGVQDPYDGSSGIYARRFNSVAKPLSDEFRVNTIDIGPQIHPAIASDNDGNFIIAWESQSQDGSFFNNVKAQRYRFDGSPIGSEFRVDDDNEPGLFGDSDPAVAMAPNGNFAISWDRRIRQTMPGVPFFGSEVFFRMYDANGSPIISPTQVNRTGVDPWNNLVDEPGPNDGSVFLNGSAQEQRNSSITMDDNGNVTVVWESLQDNDVVGTPDLINSWGIFLRRFHADGRAEALFGQDLQVNPIFSFDPNTADPPLVSPFFAFDQLNPSVGLDADGDLFVVYDGYGAATYFGDLLDTQGIWLRRWTASSVLSVVDEDTGTLFIEPGNTPAPGALNWPLTAVNTTRPNSQQHPTIAVQPNGSFIVVWSGNGSGDTQGIYAQRYRESADPVGPQVTEIRVEAFDTVGQPVPDDRQLVLQGDQVVGSVTTLVAVLDEQASTAGGTTGVNSVLNRNNWKLLRNGVEVLNAVTSVSFQNNPLTNKWEATVTLDSNGPLPGTPALVDGNYELIALNKIRDVAGNPLGSNGTDESGFSFSRSFNVIASQGGESLVNVTKPGVQALLAESPQAVATDAAGNYVVTWTAVGQDGDAADQTNVYARRFSADGAPLSGEFRVNTTSVGNQSNSAVAMTPDGDFIIVWSGESSDLDRSWDIYAQRFDSLGNRISGEFLVNTTTTSIQSFPTVALDSEGDFIIAWQSFGQETSTSGDPNLVGYGVYAQRYSAAGEPLGGVNDVQAVSFSGNPTSGTFSLQFNGFVYGPISYTPANAGNTTATAIETAFRNPPPGIPAVDVEVRAVSSTKFEMTFVGRDGSRDQGQMVAVGVTLIGGTSPGIRVQTTTDGVAGEFLVNDTVVGNQRFPQAAMDSDGDFAIVWVSTGQEGDQFFESNVYGKTYVRNELLTGSGGASLDELVFGHRDHEGHDHLQAGSGASYDGLLAGPPTGPIADDFVVGQTEPGKWGPPQFGTGAVVTWAFMGAGIEDANDLEDGWTSVSLDSVMPVGYKDQIRQAFAAWSRVANLTFVEVVDGGEDFGDEGPADIRVGAHDIDGPFGVLAHAFFPPENGGFVAGDVHFDAGENWQIGFGTPGFDIFQVMAHELGHSLGLGHTSVPNSLMNPAYSEGFRGPQFDDIAGIQFLYGAADNGATRPEFRVNQTISGNQFAPSVAMDLDGDFVVTWTSYGQDRNGTGYGFGEGGQNGVFARRFTADGSPMTSQTFVESYVSGNAPLVIADLGATASELKVGDDFIVTDLTVTVDITHPRVSDVQIELYAPGQDPFAGGVGLVLAGGLGGNGRNYNGTTFSDSAGTLILDADPPFTGTFIPFGSLAGTFGGLRAQGTWRLVVRDTATGQVGQLNGWSMNFRGIVDAGDEFQVNRFADGNQQYSRVGMNGAGDFIIAWESFQDDSVRLGTPSDYGVYAQRYVRRELLSTQAFATGGAVGSQFRVPFTKLGDQRYPSAALDAGGDFVVVWTGRGDAGGVTIDNPGVFQRRFTASADTGSPIVTGVLHLANEVQRLAITGNPTSGSFSLRLGSTTYGPFAYTPGSAASVAAAMDAALSVDFDVTVAAVNNFEFTFTFSGSDGATDIPPLAVVGATFVGGTTPAAATSVDVSGVTDPVVERDVVEQTVQKLVVRFSEQLSIAGGITGLNSVINPANWIISRNGVVLTDAIVSVTFGLSQASVEGLGSPSGKWEAVVTFDANTSLSGLQPLGDGEYVLTALPAIRDLQGNPLDGNFDGSPGGSFNRRFFIQIPPPGGDGESRVNTTIPPVQRLEPESPSTIAADADGDYVVVWTSAGQDGDGDGVYLQRFSANGTPLGPETLVNQTTRGNQNHGNVALDADGDYIITWTSYGQNGDGASSGNVYARRYTSDGTPVSDEFLVNTFTVGNQKWSSVAVDVLGDFVITWSSYGQDGSGYGVYAQRYDSAGGKQGTEFQINQTTAGNQRFSAVDMDALGNFVVTWTTGNGSNGDDVVVRAFNANGTASSGEVLVNSTTAGDQRYSRVAVDLSGDFVVAWTGPDSSGTGVFFRTFDIDTFAAGAQTQANVTTVGNQQFANVQIDHDGDFVITWSGNGAQNNQVDQSGVFARRYNADGTPRPAPTEVGGGTEFLINTTLDGTQALPGIALDGEGEFVIVWAGNGDGDAQGIFSRRIRQTLDDDGPIVSDVRLSGVQILDGDVLTADVTTMNVFFGEEMSTVGDDLGFESVSNPANWALFRNGSELVGAIRDVVFDFAPGFRRWRARLLFDGDGLAGDPDNPPPLPDGTYTLVLFDFVTDTSGNQLDGNYDGEEGGNFTRTFTIARPKTAGSEFRANTTTVDAQRTPAESGQAVASDDDGDYVVVWTSGGQDGNGLGIFGQRFDRAGAKLGGEFQVNQFTTNDQAFPAVAMDADGDFVVTWTSYGQDDDALGESNVYARIYNAVGEALTDEFIVNTTEDGIQRWSSAAMDADGDLVITWTGLGQNGDDQFDGNIFARKFSFEGVAASEEFQVNNLINDYTSTDVPIVIPTQGVVTSTLTIDDDFPILDLNVRLDIQHTFVGDLNIFLISPEGTRVELVADLTPFDGDNLFGTTLDDEATVPITAGAPPYSGVFRPVGLLAAVDGESILGTWTLEITDTTQQPPVSDGPPPIPSETGGRLNSWSLEVVYAAVNTTSAGEPQATGNQQFSRVAMDALGNFVIVWEDQSGQDGSGTGVFGQVFAFDSSDANETDPEPLPLGANFRVNQTGDNNQVQPSVASDRRNGDFIVAWASQGQDGDGYGIYARRFSPTGGAASDEFQANRTTVGDQTRPAVAMSAAGDFIIAWQGNGQAVNQVDDEGVFAQCYIAGGGRRGGEFRVNTSTADAQELPSVAADGRGDFVIVWSGNGDQPGQEDTIGVFGQRLAVDSDTAGPIVADVVFDGIRVGSEEDLIGPVDVLIVSFGEEMFVDAVTATNSVTNPANWALTRGGAGGAGGVASVTFGFNQAFIEGIGPASGKFEAVVRLDSNGAGPGTPGFGAGTYTLSVSRNVRDLFGNNLDGDFLGSGGQGGTTFSLSFTVAGGGEDCPGGLDLDGDEERVNTTLLGLQDFSDVASDSRGNYVVVWASAGQVLAQRFNAAGLPQGNEFVVNSVVQPASLQPAPQVAMDSNGDFVVAWAGRDVEYDSDRDGVFARRYSRVGVAQGAQFLVNTTKTGLQNQPDVAMDDGGDFVVTWTSYGQNGQLSGIYAQRFNSNGAKAGGEFAVNTNTASQKEKPKVALDRDGDFAITWASYGQDGSSWGVYAQRFDAGGAKIDGEFRANQFAFNAQREPAVAMDADGDFVIAWQSDAQDGSGYGVYARRFSRLGGPAGDEFRVNSYTLNWQRLPDVAMDDAGNFLVTWQSFGQDTDRNGIFLKAFTPDGAPAVDPATGVVRGDTQINTTFIGEQATPAIAADASGNYIVTWTGQQPISGVDLGDIFSQRLCFDPTKATLSGTAGADTLTVTLGPAGITQLTLNGQALNVSSYVKNVIFDGGAGANAIVIGGNPTGEQLQVSPGGGTLVGSGYSLQFANISQTTATGGGAGSSATLLDSAGNDTLTATPAGATLTGPGYSIRVNNYGRINVVASAGQDVATLADSSGNDTLTARAYSTTLAGPGYTQTVSNFKQVTVTGSGGFDRAQLHDSSANDTFTARPQSSQMSGSGYKNVVQGFDEVRGFASLGVDRAELFDSAGADTLTVKPEFAQFVGSSFFSYAKGFDDVRATSSGGQDKAFLYDSTGTETLTLRPQSAQLVGTSYFAQTSNFPEVRAYATAGGDSVLLYDGAGDDRLLATPEYAQLTGGGFFNYAKGFRNVRAYASQGANSAVLYSSAGNDELVARSDYTQLSGKGYYNYAKNFGEVRAYAQGNGQAYLYDSSGDDALLSTPQFSQLVGPGYLNYAAGFATVRTFASAGNDAAAIYDSAGRDELLATPEYAQLSGSGYTSYVKNFKTVNVQAGRGGEDVARLQDSTANDQLVTRPQSVELRGAGYTTVARNFATVEVTSRGGQDQALMYTAASGTNELYAGSQTSRLVSGGAQQTVVGFSNVEVQATGGYNRAHLVDSVLADELDAAGDTAMIKNAAWVAQIRSFQEVTAETIFNDKKNTKQVSAVDYLFTDKWF